MQMAMSMHPTLLRTSGKRGGFPLERILPGSPARYSAEEMLNRARRPARTVALRPQANGGEVRSSAPF